MTDLPPAALRVADAARDLGLDVEVRVMPASTRTAADAAAACGTTVAQIVKSLVFAGAGTGKPYLLLVSGPNRVDEAGAAETIGEPLARMEARSVRDVTGFAIGGIPPLGHATPMATYIDQDLLGFAEVWAAAGTPSAVFRIDPARLRDAVGAIPIRMG